MLRRLFWMLVGGGLALYAAQKARRMVPTAGVPVELARRVARNASADLRAALAAGRAAKRRAEGELWASLGEPGTGRPVPGGAAGAAGAVGAAGGTGRLLDIEAPAEPGGAARPAAAEPFEPLRKALGNPRPRR